MNILEMGLLYNQGGASTVMHQIADISPKNGNNVYIIAAYNKNNAVVRKQDMVLFDASKEVANKYLERLSNEKYLFNLAVVVRILAFAKKNNINVIHYHAVENFLGIREIYFISMLYPVVWTMHDCWCFTGGCQHTFSCQMWKNKCADCSYKDQINGVPYNNLKLKYKYLTKGNIIYTAPSKWLVKKAEESVLHNQKIVQIQNGVNVKMFNFSNKKNLRLKYGIPIDKNVLLFCATNLNNGYKGFQILYKALELLDKDKYFLLIVGDTKGTHLSNEICQYSSFGYVKDKKEMNQIYLMADLFVIPSIQENFPCVVLEAMASGTPTIAFNVGGIPEQISNGCGVVCQSVDSQKLAEQISAVFQDESGLQKMSANCREKAIRLYDEEKIVGMYHKLYKTAIRKKGGKHKWKNRYLK